MKKIIKIMTAPVQIRLVPMLILALAFSVSAQADLVLMPGVGYTTSTEKVSGTKTSDTKLIDLDGRVGWMAASSGFYIGGMYKYESGTDIGSSLKAVSVGPSLGFMGHGFSLIGTYFLQGSRSITVDGVEEQYKKGTGFQVDAAFMGGITPEFYVGPQLSYRSMKYKTSTTAGVSSDANYQLDTIQPTLAFLFKF